MTKLTVVSRQENLQQILNLWADNITDTEGPNREQLIRYRTRVTSDFFNHVGKMPKEVSPFDIKAWQTDMEAKPLAQNTIYAYISQLSSFFNWAKEKGLISYNPVDLARPQAPKPYQTGTTKSLSDRDVRALLLAIERTTIIGKRDYAMLLLYLSTGMRRQEIIQLSRDDMYIDSTIVFTTRVKGGAYITAEVTDPRTRAAILEYLDARTDSYKPLWLAHDRSGTHIGKPLSSHGFVANLKKYAKEAGIEHIHLHQTRHTYARIVADETGSMVETQEALGHSHLSTTRVYVQAVGIKKDKHSSKIANRLFV